jgi:hypothetical protein
VIAEGEGDVAGLRRALEDAGVADGAVLIPPEAGAGKGVVYWFVIRWNGSRAWRRIFEDVKPVPPQVWREVNRKRGNLLDHPDKGDIPGSGGAQDVSPVLP